MNGNGLTSRIGLIGLFVLAGLGIAVLMAVAPAGAITTGDAYPGTGDWVISSDTRVIDEVVTVYGNVSVEGKLELWNATIEMSQSRDNEFKFVVTPNGNLMANDSLITSTLSFLEFGFHVKGPMTLDRVVVEETWGGVRVMTDNKVVIKNSQLIKAYGSGLYLEDADGTTISNVLIQADDLRVYGNMSAVSYDYNDYRQYPTAIADSGAVLVNGGNPTIEDVEVSVNGTMEITARLTKYYAYFYCYLNVYMPAVVVNSTEMSSVSGITVRDSTVDVVMRWYLTSAGSYSNYRWYLYAYGYVATAVALNYGDVELSDCHFDNVGAGKFTHYVTKYGLSSYHSTYGYDRGGTLYGAIVNKMFTNAGPHNFKVTIKDASYENVPVLATSFTPDYNGAVEPEFHTTIVIQNVSINKGNYPFTFTVAPKFQMAKRIYSDILIKDGTFTNFTGPMYQYDAKAGGTVNPNVRNFEFHDTVRVEDCVFRGSRSSQYGLFYEQSPRSNEFNNEWDRHLEIVRSKFLDGTGYLFYFYGNLYVNRGQEWFLLKDSLVQNYTGQYFMRFYYRNQIQFINNTIRDCSYNYYNYVYAYGGYSNGKQPANILFHKNRFLNLDIGQGDYGSWYCLFGGDITFTNNTFDGLEHYFMRLYPYTYYAGYAEAFFRGNTWTNLTQDLFYCYFYYNYISNFVWWIEDNYGYDSDGGLMSYYETYAQSYDVEPTLIINNNTMEGFPGTVFNIYGKVTITNNRFEDCGGPVIYLDHLGQTPPIINNNVIKNCDDVYYIGAKPRGALRMSITISDLNIDCTGTAFHFSNIDATMSNVIVSTRAQLAIIAENAIVDCMGCIIPIGSGQVISTGEIYVWFELELWVEWANFEDQLNSSGVPVEDALVVLYGASGAYFTSSYTDEEGHIRPTNLPQWSMVGSFLSVWTPYNITVTKAGVTQTDGFDLDKDVSGQDALWMLLVDPEIPVIRITSPFAGTVFNSEELRMRGFSTEIGSGIGNVSVAIGDGDWAEVIVDQNGDFMHTFTDLPEGGDVEIRARVYDVATNVNETSILVTIDRTPPRLVITEPKDGVIVNEPGIVIVGEYEPGATITINGLERPGSTGILSEEFTLSEGNNTIVVVATDPAGNFATEVRTLRLDRFSPTLTVLAPRDGLVTSMTGITVEGEVESGSTITISVYRTGSNTIDEVVTPRPDGSYFHKVDLEEGLNTIVVTAIDSAMNPSQVTRRVTVDTTAPMCTITSPEEGHLTATNTILVTGTADVEGITLYLNGKQIFNDGAISRYVDLNEGTNVIVLRAVDPIGNIYEDSVTVYLDTTAPVVLPLRPRSTSVKVNVDQLIVSAQVGENRDLEAITVMGNSVSWTPIEDPDLEDDILWYEFSTTVTIPKEGVTEILVVAWDKAGNVGTHTVSVDLSTVRPMLFLAFSPSTPTVTGDNPNLYISGTTTTGIEEVWVTHDTGGDPVTSRVTVAEDGSFNVVRTLLDGDNIITVSATDAYGNTNTTAEYTVNYVFKEKDDGGPDTEPIPVSAVALWVLVIAIALFITAVVVTRMLRRD